MEKAKTRIQQRNEEKIIESAVIVFSKYGFRGSTLDQIASLSSMSKPNILYYFKNKQEVYNAVLQYILNSWLKTFELWDESSDPVQTLSHYIETKLIFSRDYPRESRLFANEILEGAPSLRELLANEPKDIFQHKIKIMEAWASQGLINPTISAEHLIYAIWSLTQHYADYDAQIVILSNRNLSDESFFNEALETIKQIILASLTTK